MEAESGDLGRREPRRSLLDRVRERLPRQRLEDEHKLRPFDQFVCADDVGMAESLDQATLRAQPPSCRTVVELLGPQDLGDADAVALVAPHRIRVERPPAAQVRDDPVAASKLRAFDEDAAHAAAVSTPWSSYSRA